MIYKWHILEDILIKSGRLYFKPLISSFFSYNLRFYNLSSIEVDIYDLGINLFLSLLISLMFLKCSICFSKSVLFQHISIYFTVSKYQQIRNLWSCILKVTENNKYHNPIYLSLGKLSIDNSFQSHHTIFKKYRIILYSP